LNWALFFPTFSMFQLSFHPYGGKEKV